VGAAYRFDRGTLLGLLFVRGGLTLDEALLRLGTTGYQDDLVALLGLEEAALRDWVSIAMRSAATCGLDSPPVPR
jgi:hypothetical protein